MNQLLKRILFLFSTVILSVSFNLKAANQSDLKVLFAGTPDSPRTADFKKFLQHHFSKVGTISYKSFKPSDADGYDVVVFDWDIDAITESTPTKELPKNYSHPSVTIGSAGPTIGEPLGLKIDWLCLCLDHSAHDMVEDHPLFQKPHKINFKLEEYPHHYSVDRNLTMKIWRIQTKGYSGGEIMPGLVSTGYGFDDSPDAERISSGLCAKGPKEVAIGRHANFLHWGFYAQPAYMTEQGKLAFINAIHYIKQFDGHTPIVHRKSKPREYALANASMIERVPGYYKMQKEEYEQLAAKKAKGETLSEFDQLILEQGPEQQSLDDAYKEFLSGMPTDLVKRFGKDGGKYVKYYTDNLEYLFYTGSNHNFIKNSEFSVDQDAKSLGISNRDPKLLDKSISLLENNQQTDLATRLLTRYTNKTFATAKQWRDWFTENRDRIFFTDIGGYKFMVNTLKNST